MNKYLAALVSRDRAGGIGICNGVGRRRDVGNRDHG